MKTIKYTAIITNSSDGGGWEEEMECENSFLHRSNLVQAIIHAQSVVQDFNATRNPGEDSRHLLDVKLKRPAIKSVKGLFIGDIFQYENFLYEVTSFPSRSTVCGDNIDYRSGMESGAEHVKAPISKVVKV